MIHPVSMATTMGILAYTIVSQVDKTDITAVALFQGFPVEAEAMKACGQSL